MSGIDLQHFRTSSLIPYDDGMRIWKAAEQLTGDRYVGLSAGALYGVDQLSALGSVIAHAANVRDALAAVARILPMVVRDVPIDYADEAGSGRLRYVSPGTERHGVDCMFAALVRAARDCTRRHLTAQAVEFQCAPPEDVTPYVKFFGVKPIWSRPASVLRFSTETLDTVMRGAEPKLAALLEDRAKTLLAAQGASLESRLEAAIRVALARADISLECVAAGMRTSARSLQRQLQAEGLHFAVVRDRVLLERATELLADPSRRVDDIAMALCYADRAAFVRAYRRWTGATPRSTVA